MQLFNDKYDPAALAAAEKGGLGGGRRHARGGRARVLLLHVGGRARLQPLLARWKRRAGSLIVLVAGEATLALWKIFFLALCRIFVEMDDLRLRSLVTPGRRRHMV